MNKLRTHIVRVVVLVLIWMGFSLYIVQSAKAEYSSRAFARWFSTMLSSSNTAELQEQLNELRKSNDHLDEILKKASKIVRRNNKDFKLPFAESVADSQVYELLLFEWNQYQTENAMAGIPAQQTVKSLLPIKVDKSASCGAVAATIATPRVLQWIETAYPFNNRKVPFWVIPMSSGIAIGAP